MNSEVNQAMMRESEEDQPRASCFLLSARQRQLLVPRNLVAEVVRHSFVEFSEHEESGLVMFSWRGCSVPHVNDSLENGITTKDIDEESRVVVCYGLVNNRKLPFYGITVTVSPQPLQLADNDLEVMADAQLSSDELMKVKFQDKELCIPKVEYLEKSILKLVQ